jgi:hypothetical protein
MATDNDIKKDYEEAYNAGQASWYQYWEEAKKDVQHRLGNQYSAHDKAYLKSQDREALVWNKAHRVCNTISGYEQKNILALKVEPFEGADEKTASQFSALLMHNMLYGGGYMCTSDAFENGPVIAGMNLIEPWVDRTYDLLNGEIKFRRLPYNRFVLDPTFTNRNLDEDCGFVITRDYFNKQQTMGMLPDRMDEIGKMKGSGGDSKFGLFYPQRGRNNEYNLKYDRFYAMTFREFRILADTKTGQMVPLPNQDDPRFEEVVRMFMGRYPSLRMIRGMRKGVDLHIFIEGELMYSGVDSSGLDEYPFVLSAGYWTPEEEDSRYRMQGVVRVLRDPGVECNRRRSMILDILDSQIRSGWKAKDGSVVNREELYQAGGSSVVWIDKNAEMNDADRLDPPTFPQGLLQATEAFDKDHDELSGVNAEMMGAPENDDIEVAAILAKIRAGKGLTTLQSLFSNHRYSKSLLGRKQIKMIQKNFTPAKIARIINEQPTQEFYSKDFGKYDCVPAEGVLTDTQRQQHYAQIMAWKKAGAPIPWGHILDFAPMENKDKLKEAVKQQEQAQAQMQKEQRDIEMLGKLLLQADMQQKIASSKERLSQADENRSNATLDRAKAMKEMQDMDIESFSKTVSLLMQLKAILNGEQPGQQGQGQQGAPMLPKQMGMM